ncbi:MAG TPA: glycosyltransferase family 4 protein [Vicinamibacteria bacterium]
MRILLMSQSYPPVLGGLQTATAQLAKHLSASGHDVLVVANRFPRDLPRFERIDGVQVHRLLFLSPRLGEIVRGRIDLFLGGSVLGPLQTIRLGRLIRIFEPQVVNLHFPLSMIPFVMRVRRKLDFRLVVSLHGDEIERWLDPGAPANGLRSDLGRLLRQADSVTACSRYLLEQACLLEPDVARKGTAIPNGVDPDRFRKGITRSERSRYLLAYGRLTRKKGFDLLLEAFARVSREFPGIDLILAGEGEERAALQSLADRLAISKRTIFLGRATPAQAVELLHGSDFVVVPSRREPFGIVALEALAAGKPVLATLVGGLPEILSNDDPNVAPSLMVTPTVDDLERGLRSWLTCQPPRGSEASRLKLLERNSWAAVAARYERVFAG